MDARCLLCDHLMPAPTVRPTVPLQEDPDAICPRCRALSPEARKELRDQAMARIMRRATARDSF